MTRLLHLSPRRLRRFVVFGAPAWAAFALLVAMAGCGAVGCPDGLRDVDGVCQEVDRFVEGPAAPLVEQCDGVDNDGDDDIDEDWPELGNACGGLGGVGECVEGTFVCAEHGRGVVCEGAIGPTAEVCDGKDNDCDGVEDNGPDEVCDGEDNDCDGLVDEGVLAVKQERFSDHATVAEVDGGFVLTQLLADQLRVETYAADGTRTGHHDDIANPALDSAFVTSSLADGRLVVGLGKHRFYVVEAHIDSELVPIVTATQPLHEAWDQGIDWGIYEPPYHPRVSASPARFFGHRDVVTFALSPFGQGDLTALSEVPLLPAGFPYLAYFDAAGAFVAWEHDDNVRIGWLLDDGELVLDIDVGRGSRPSIAFGADGPSVAYLRDGRLLLSELGGLTLQCTDTGLCNAEVDPGPIDSTVITPTGHAYDPDTDSWVVVVGSQVWLVARGEAGPVVTQTFASVTGDDPPTRVDVAWSGGTAAVVQSQERGDSTLTFMGCF